jgi:hypothetical protein
MLEVSHRYCKLGADRYYSWADEFSILSSPDLACCLNSIVNNGSGLFCSCKLLLNLSSTTKIASAKLALSMFPT